MRIQKRLKKMMILMNKFSTVKQNFMYTTITGISKPTINQKILNFNNFRKENLSQNTLGLLYIS